MRCWKMEYIKPHTPRNILNINVLLKHLNASEKIKKKITTNWILLIFVALYRILMYISRKYFKSKKHMHTDIDAAGSQASIHTLTSKHTNTYYSMWYVKFSCPCPFFLFIISIAIVVTITHNICLYIARHTNTNQIHFPSAMLQRTMESEHVIFVPLFFPSFLSSVWRVCIAFGCITLLRCTWICASYTKIYNENEPFLIIFIFFFFFYFHKNISNNGIDFNCFAIIV